MMTVAEQQQYLTSEEVARRLNVDHSAVKRWLRLGRMTGYQFGKQWRVRIDDFEQFVRESRNTDPETKTNPDTDKWPIMRVPEYGEELSG